MGKEYSKNKQLVINTAASIISQIISLGISFILSPFIVGKLGTDAYGFIALSNNFVSYVTIITIALNSMASRFITIKIHEGDYEKASKYYNSVVFSNLIISLALLVPSVLCIIYLERIMDIPKHLIFDVKILFFLSFLSFYISLVFSVFSTTYFVKNKLYIQSKINVESNFIRVAVLLILFLLFKPTLSYMGVAGVVLVVYKAVYDIYYKSKLLPEIKISRKFFDFSAIKELLAAGSWNVINKISSMLATEFDLLITITFIGATAMGQISLSKVIPAQMLMLFALIAANFAPNFTEYYAKKEFEALKKELLFSIKTLGFMATIPIAILYSLGRQFFSLWIPGEDAMLLHILSILTCLAFPFSMPIESLWNIFTITNKVKVSSIYLVINSVISIIVTLIVLNLTDDIVVRMMAIVGISSILSVIRALFFLPIYGGKCINIGPKVFYKPMFINVVALAVITAVGLLIGKIFLIDSWMKLILAAITLGIIGLLVNYLILFSKEDKIRAKDIFFTKVLKRRRVNAE